MGIRYSATRQRPALPALAQTQPSPCPRLRLCCLVFVVDSFVCEVFMLSIATKMFARVEDAVHGLCSCSSFSGSCFRPFRRYVSFRNFCVGGQSIHVTFSTRAADMYTDMPRVDRGATATSGIRAQNAFRFFLGSSVRSALVRSHFGSRLWTPWPRVSQTPRRSPLTSATSS